MQTRKFCTAHPQGTGSKQPFEQCCARLSVLSDCHVTKSSSPDLRRRRRQQFNASTNSRLLPLHLWRFPASSRQRDRDQRACPSAPTSQIGHQPFHIRDQRLGIAGHRLACAKLHQLFASARRGKMLDDGAYAYGTPVPMLKAPVSSDNKSMLISSAASRA